jgi:hypothetical protein
MSIFEINNELKSLIGEKVRRLGKRKSMTKKFKSGLFVNTVKDIINHPITNRPAFIFKEDKSYLECTQCEKAIFDENNNLILPKKGHTLFLPRTTNNLIKVYPVGIGKHENTYFIARDRKKNFKFTICCYNNTSEANIIDFKTNIDSELLNSEIIYNQINKGLSKWNFELKTLISDIFKIKNNS